MLRRIGNSLALIIAAFCLFVASPAVRAQDITTDLIGHWKLDETSGTTAADSAGTAQNGTLVDGPVWQSTNGRINGALEFDGVNDTVDVGSIDSASGAITLTAWIKADTFDLAQMPRIISKANDTAATAHWWMLGINEGVGARTIEVRFKTGGTTESDLSTGTVPVGVWTHVAVTYDPSLANEITYYINGVQDSTDNNTLGGSLNTDATVLVGIGNNHSGATGTERAFDGLIDEVRIYDRALSATDVDALYRARHPGTIQYNTNFRAPEYFDGAVWTAMGKKTWNPNAINLRDGSVNYLARGGTLSGVADGKTVTGSVWFRTTQAAAPAGGGQELFVTTRSADNNGAFGVVMDDASHIAVFGRNAGGTPILDLKTTAAALNDGNWHHALFSIDLTDTSKRHIYIDGVADLNALTYDNTQGDIDFVNQNHFVGRGKTTATDSQFNGDIADLWIDFGTYIDLSSPVNRAKFYNGGPVYLGADGSIPTGTVPDVFFSGETASWHTNKGTGGGFTKTGTPATSYSGPASPLTATLSTMGAALGGGNKWDGGVLGPDGKIYGMPRSAADILIIDTVTGTATRSTMGATITGGWEGGALGPDRKIYGIPSGSGANKVLIIDTTTGTATTSTMGAANLSDNNKWSGGVAGPDGKIYGIPEDATDILIIDPVAGTATRSAMGATLTGSQKWFGGVLGPNGKIYGIPWSSTDILIIDPIAGTATRSAMGVPDLSDAQKWDGGTLGPDGKIYANPFVSTDILIIDPVAGTATRSAMGANLAGGTKWQGTGAVGADGRIYVAGSDSATSLVIDPVAGTAQRTNFGLDLSAGAKWDGTVAGPDGKVYGIPRSATDILIIDPVGGCTNPARDGGTMIYNTTTNVMQYCNGSAWIAMGPVPGAGGGGCSNPARPRGQMVFNTSQNVMQYCDGTDWVEIGKEADPCEHPSVAPGAKCSNGTVYAGLSPDGNVKMYTTPSDAGLITWNNGTGNYIDTAMVGCTSVTPGGQTSCQTGEANTTFLVGLSDAASPYAAAVYCDGLSVYGHTDWYLPAQDELYTMYTNRVALGNFDTSGSIPGGYYWSSSEQAATNARYTRFSDGTQGNVAKNNARSVRCVRK